MKKPEWPEITEEHAKEILSLCCFETHDMKLEALESLKEYGYIKKSALDEARELKDDIIKGEQFEPFLRLMVSTVSIKYEKAIEELENKK